MKCALLLVVLSLAIPCQAQKPNIEDHFTKGTLNGRFWNSLPEDSRLWFILGYCEGTSQFWLACPTEVENGELVKGIDRFYQEPENLRLPVITAMAVFTQKVRGASPTLIESLMKAARDFADKPGETHLFPRANEPAK